MVGKKRQFIGRIIETKMRWMWYVFQEKMVC